MSGPAICPQPRSPVGRTGQVKVDQLAPAGVAVLRCDVGTRSEIKTRMVNQLVCDELKRK